MVMFRGRQYNGGRMLLTEVASLIEGEWSCYRGGHFNGGRKVIRGSVVVSLMEGG